MRNMKLILRKMFDILRSEVTFKLGFRTDTKAKSVHGVPSFRRF